MERATIRQPATTHLSEQEAQPHDRELTSVIPLKRCTQIHSSVSTATLTSNECTDRKLCFIKTKMPTSNYLNIWRLPSLQMHCSQTKHLKFSILEIWRTLFGTFGFSPVYRITFKCIVIFNFVKQQGFSDTSVVNSLLRSAWRG